MTLKEIAQSEKFRADLADAISHPTLNLALDALSEDNMPELVIKAIPGMDPLTAIALDAAKRAGAQSMIKRLRRLPFVTISQIDRAKLLQAPWEWLESDEPSPHSTKPKKPAK